MRNERVNIYVTDDEKEIIDQNARAYGMTRFTQISCCCAKESISSPKDRLRIPLWMTVLRSLKTFLG